MNEDHLLFVLDSEQSPEFNGSYECLIHDYEAGPYLYTEMVEYKDGIWEDQAHIVAWRPKQ